MPGSPWTANGASHLRTLQALDSPGQTKPPVPSPGPTDLHRLLPLPNPQPLNWAKTRTGMPRSHQQTGSSFSRIDGQDLVYVIARKSWALDCFLWEGRQGRANNT